MYSYVAAGTSGAGLPAKKRLQVNQALNGSSGPYNTQTLDLDAVYTYNNEGSVASTTYPTTYAVNNSGALTGTSGPAYTYSFDSLYRPSGLTTTTGNSTIVSGVSYGPSNQLLSISYNGVSEYRSYNSLLQLTGVYSFVTQAPAEQYVNMQYNYPINPVNNGKACLATDSIAGEQVTYSYDSLNRLSAASAYVLGLPSNSCNQTLYAQATWSQTYSYDGFGNLTNKAGTGGGPNVPIGANPTNNQITDGAPQYDANGNLTAQTGVSYTYDAENRMTYFSSVNNGGATFGYDSQNKRILNWTGSTDQYGNASGYSVYYYGVKGERLGVYTFSTSYWAGTKVPTLQNAPASTETFFGARRLAPLDRLGSARSVNNTASSYYPFGEDKSTNPAIDAWKFGSYWRDSTSGLDYADQQYYSSSIGRFLTADHYVSGNGPAQPQSWNRYAYVQGDPANYGDPSGKDEFFCGDGTDSIYDGGCYLGNPCDPYASSFDPLGPIIPSVACSVGVLAFVPPPAPPKCPKNIMNFFSIEIPYASQLANTWSTSVNDVLALSAYESGWLNSHNQNLHNPYGLTNAGGNNINFTTGYQAATNYWSQNDGSYIKGVTDIAKFAANLQPHYNTVNPGWAATLQMVYASVLYWRAICGQ